MFNLAKKRFSLYRTIDYNLWFESQTHKSQVQIAERLEKAREIKMDKKKTSKKPKISSKNIVKLKPNVDVIPYNPTKDLINPDFIGKAIMECLLSNDPDGVMEVIKIYLNTLNKVKLAEKINISRSTLYHSIKAKNPTIKTLAKIISTGIKNSPKREFKALKIDTKDFKFDRDEANERPRSLKNK